MEELQNATPEETRRIDALRSLLLAHDTSLDAKGRRASVSVYCYRDSWGGVRLSEISLVWRREGGTGGASWMASDLDAFPVIYAAEQYLNVCLHEVEDHGAGAVYDPEQEARRGLLYWLMHDQDYNALPEWEERTDNPLASLGARA